MGRHCDRIQRRRSANADSNAVFFIRILLPAVYRGLIFFKFEKIFLRDMVEYIHKTERETEGNEVR